MKNHVPLAPLCTLGTGGNAETFDRVTTEAQLETHLRETTGRITILGSGSNVVVPDAGVPGLVLHMAIGGITFKDGAYTVGAGVDWDTFVAQTLEDERPGLEVMSGIPGTVGATPIQNVGAYGREVGEFLQSVRVYDRQIKAFTTLSVEQLGLSYRHSVLKRRDRYIVTAITIAPRPGKLQYAELVRAMGAEEAPADRVRDMVLALRKGKGMVLDPRDPESKSVGSFFTNPIVASDFAIDAAAPRYPQPDGRIKLAAGWLVEAAGNNKGDSVGGARISKKHALAIVNGGGATSHDVLALAAQIQEKVRAKFDIALEPEPVFL